MSNKQNTENPTQQHFPASDGEQMDIDSDHMPTHNGGTNDTEDEDDQHGVEQINPALTIRESCFRKLVTEIAQEVARERGEKVWVKQSAILKLQEAAEEFLVKRFETMAALAREAGDAVVTMDHVEEMEFVNDASRLAIADQEELESAIVVTWKECMGSSA